MLPRKSASRNTESLFQNAVMTVHPTMLMACARTATMPEGEPRRRTSVIMVTDPFMLRAFAKIATSAFTTRKRGPLRRHNRLLMRKALKSLQFRQGDQQEKVVLPIPLSECLAEQQLSRDLSH